MYIQLILFLNVMYGSSCTVQEPGYFSDSESKENQPGDSVFIASAGHKISKREDRGCEQ